METVEKISDIADTTEDVTVDESNQENVIEEAEKLTESEKTTEDVIEDVQEESKEEPKEEVKEEAKPESETFNIKVNGETYELTKDEILKMAQKAKGADEKFREAAEMREQLVDLVKMLKERPTEVFDKLGIDFKKMAEEELYSRYKYEKLPENEKKLMDYEKRIKEMEIKASQNETERKQQEEKQLTEYYKQQSETMIGNALTASNLPKTTDTVRRMAFYMSKAIDKGIEINQDNVNEIVKIVEEDYKNDIKHFSEKLPSNKKNEFLGVPNKPENKIQEPIKGTSTAGKNGKYMTWKEYRNMVKQVVG